MQEKKYLILLDIDARKRHYHATEAGKIIKFVVQLELKSGGVWKEVIRYDCAHDYAHKDCYNAKGPLIYKLTQNRANYLNINAWYKA
ncbi:MAG: hypothetical protein ISS67_07615 [Desulfobacterales bacterium]|nr:hypothetical protein [Desulfobacterales bacterium]